MEASPRLWKKLHTAQDRNCVDATYAYREAIKNANKGSMNNADWWETQGDKAMPTAVREKEKEHVTS